MDVCQVIKDFFASGKLLSYINTTLLALVPKIENPITPNELRPIVYYIACYNTIYKCITKILSERMKATLAWLEDNSQGAFIPGGSILHNVLLCEDPVKFYKRKNISPQCTMKLELKKAYDTIRWQCLQQILLL